MLMITVFGNVCVAQYMSCDQSAIIVLLCWILVSFAPNLNDENYQCSSSISIFQRSATVRPRSNSASHHSSKRFNLETETKPSKFVKSQLPTFRSAYGRWTSNPQLHRRPPRPQCQCYCWWIERTTSNKPCMSQR